MTTEEHHNDVIFCCQCSHILKCFLDDSHLCLVVHQETDLSLAILLVEPLHRGGIVVRQTEVVLRARVVRDADRQKVYLRLADQWREHKGKSQERSP